MGRTIGKGIFLVSELFAGFKEYGCFALRGRVKGGALC